MLAPLLSSFLISVASSSSTSNHFAQEPPSPTQANIAYAPSYPSLIIVHLLDLYLPAKAAKPIPFVIYIGVSSCKSDNDNVKAEYFAA